MKKLIIAAAAAALLSGAAFAQNTAAQQGDKTQAAAGTNAAFCLDVRGAQSCKFATMADCQKEAKGNGSCVANPKAGTTGSAAGAAKSSTTSPAASNPGTDKPGSSTLNKGASPEKGK